MAFRDFTFPDVQDKLGLIIGDADLFSSVHPSQVSDNFAAFIEFGTAVAQANSTEKAKSEFIIAPVLLELKRTHGTKFNLFSGLEWTVDTNRGLNGYCDFILGRGRSQHFLQSPFVAVVEAKNDIIPTGFGQCIAAMYAAKVCNDKTGDPATPVYGVVTTGATWKFLQLVDSSVTIDVPEYFIENLPKVMGILKVIVDSSVPTGSG